MDCIFCKIAKKELDTQLLFENENLMAFKDINPVAPVHVLVIPKKHIESLNDMETYDTQLISEIMTVIQKLARQFDIDESGYRVFINCGPDGGQEIPHLHVHMIGGRKLGNCW